MVSELNSLIQETKYINAGGSDYVGWIQEILNIYINELPLHGAGGLVVPQLGNLSGTPLSFLLKSVDQRIDNTSNTLEQKILTLWNSGVTSTQFIDTNDVENENVVCVFVPICLNFNRPIGYFWALGPNKIKKDVTSTLEYAANSISSIVYSERVRLAIEYLAKPAWISTTTTKRTVSDVIEACLAAISASEIIVWTVDEPTQRLETLASIGNMGDQLKVNLRVGEGVAGKCAQECKTIIIDDLLDENELNEKGINSIGHLPIVKKAGWRCAIFAPLDTGVGIVGVISAYGPRPRAYSTIDKNILLAFAQRLSAGYIHATRIDDLTEMERRMGVVTPAIEAGILAMERVHDAENELLFAKNSLSDITINLQNNPTHKYYIAAKTAGQHIDQAQKVIGEFTRRSKMQRINPSRIILYDLLNEVKNRLQLDADEVKASIRITCPTNFQIHADKDKLMRVFINLLSNSIYWLETDGKSGQRQISIRVEPSEESVNIYVKDNGPGISPYQIRKIFDYFYSTKSDSMGFGLSIVKNIIEGHNGSISVQSKWGYETEFKIVLPLSVEKHLLSNPIMR